MDPLLNLASSSGRISLHVIMFGPAADLFSFSGPCVQKEDFAPMPQ
jgi:hypothetical protein